MFHYGTFADVAVVVTVGAGVGRFSALEVDFVEFELEFEFCFVDCVADEEECCEEGGDCCFFSH